MAAPTQRRDQQRRQRGENRARIVAAAEEALREKPFREVSIDDVMRTAGLTRTIFYRHFDDLSDLLLKVAGAAFEDLYAQMAPVAAMDGADAAALRAALVPAVDAMAKHAPLVRAIAEAASHDAEVERTYDEVMRRFEELTAEALGRLRPDLADPAQTARALTLMNVAYLLDTFGGPEPKATSEVALQTISEIWAGTIRWPAGERPVT